MTKMTDIVRRFLFEKLDVQTWKISEFRDGILENEYRATPENAFARMTDLMREGFQEITKSIGRGRYEFLK